MKVIYLIRKTKQSKAKNTTLRNTNTQKRSQTFYCQTFWKSNSQSEVWFVRKLKRSSPWLENCVWWHSKSHRWSPRVRGLPSKGPIRGTAELPQHVHYCVNSPNPRPKEVSVYPTTKLPPSLQKLQEWRRYLPKQIKIRHGGKNNCTLHTDAPEILFFPLPPNLLNFINENNREMAIYG